MDRKQGFTLTPQQVPEFPETDRWVDQLRWCIAVMDSDDDELAFAAGLLEYALNLNRLTEKQAKYAKRCISRVHALWLARQLECQHAPISRQPAPSLAAIATEGNA